MKCKFMSAVKCLVQRFPAIHKFITLICERVMRKCKEMRCHCIFNVHLISVSSLPTSLVNTVYWMIFLPFATNATDPPNLTLHFLYPTERDSSSLTAKQRMELLPASRKSLLGSHSMKWGPNYQWRRFATPTQRQKWTSPKSIHQTAPT
jgi:hypothetical protein